MRPVAANIGDLVRDRGALYALLSNPVYIGEIAHKGIRHAGLQQPILERCLWEAVQDQLREQAPVSGTSGAKVSRSPLPGKIKSALTIKRRGVEMRLVLGSGKNVSPQDNAARGMCCPLGWAVAGLFAVGAGLLWSLE